MSSADPDPRLVEEAALWLKEHDIDPLDDGVMARDLARLLAAAEQRIHGEYARFLRSLATQLDSRCPRGTGRCGCGGRGERRARGVGRLCLERPPVPRAGTGGRGRARVGSSNQVVALCALRRHQERRRQEQAVPRSPCADRASVPRAGRGGEA